MLSYTVFARRWRPRSLDAVLGQPIAVRLLEQALNMGRVHHAYLFAGPSGVGKTTLARILAKCFNCSAGVSSQPCLECDLCLSIDEGQCVDVIEIDAASRTKVEETRELLDNILYLPSLARFKIYVLDEVHMLSTHSFNALLKTVEEPPAHVIFIFATTDPDKCPQTLLSRCVFIPLQKMSLSSQCELMAQSLEKEQISFDRAALELIASSSHGNMREALNALEQALILGKGTVDRPSVSALLGVLSSDQQDALWTLLGRADVPGLLAWIAAVDAAGLGAERLLSFLQDQVHQAFVQSCLGQEPSSLLRRLYSRSQLQALYRLIALARRDLSMALSGKAALEMLLLTWLEHHPDRAEPAHHPLRLESSPVPVEALPEPPPPSQPDRLWAEVVRSLPIVGLNRQLAEHCVWIADKSLPHREGYVCLGCAAPYQSLNNAARRSAVQEALRNHYGHPHLHVEVILWEKEEGVQSPAEYYVQEALEQEAALKKACVQDPLIRSLMQDCGGRLESV